MTTAMRSVGNPSANDIFEFHGGARVLVDINLIEMGTSVHAWRAVRVFARPDSSGT